MARARSGAGGSSTRPRILVTNDDGINAPGLRLLERIARTLSSDVWVVAPETNQSGASHSLTMHRPLRIRQRQPRLGHGDESDPVRQPLGPSFRHHRHGAGHERLRHIAQPVGLHARHGHEDVARLHLPAVGREPGDLAIVRAGKEVPIRT